MKCKIVKTIAGQESGESVMISWQWLHQILEIISRIIPGREHMRYNNGEGVTLSLEMGAAVCQSGDTGNNPLTEPPSRCPYCVSFPNQLLSIQVFVIIIEKGVKGFTLLKVIPLAYASYGMWQGSRYDLDIQFKIGTCFTPSSNVRPQWQSNIADHVGHVKQASFEISQRRPCIPFISVYRKRPSVKPGFELLKLVQVH